ncbi:protein LURP-one-related 15-like isoform X1 [Tripterygium wilfordii]|uniref:Protein LURP-one-related 15-like isoform X1 n=1 Tax=Tripterygium wilfordii TaxID=458696 RepID=A0A7J7DMU6_TRIWF|nr:protein LURP-one-related 15-like isoform X1 [Tripterygium wilfordii]
MAQPIPAQLPAKTNNPVLENPVVVIGQQFIATYPVDLVIKSKWSPTEGNFGVTDVNGAVIFSIKGKFFSIHDRRILLDATGHPLVSLKQKVLSAHRRWQVFRGGDEGHDKDLVFSVRKSSFMQFKTELSVFLANNTKEEVPDFKVKGSWLETSCTIYLGDSNTIVAQVRIQNTAIPTHYIQDYRAIGRGFGLSLAHHFHDHDAGGDVGLL